MGFSSANNDEKRLLELIFTIPQGTNPYDVVIEYLRAATTPPPLPHWAHLMLRFFLVCYAVMWLQSFHLLYVRFKTRMFRLITVTRLGLWRVDVPNMSGLAYFIYPPLVIADLSLQQQIDDGRRDMTDKIPLLACKFIVVLTASWAFLWVCACQCFSNYWDRQWPEASRHGRKVQLPRYMVISINCLFVCVLTWFIPCIICLTAHSNEEYKIIKKIFGETVANLEAASSSFNQTSYQASDLIAQLYPAKEMLVHERNMARGLRVTLTIGLVNLIFLCLLYAPLLKISITAIQQRTEECTFSVAISPFEQSEQFAHIKHRVMQGYWTSFVHGLAVYLTVLILLPILIWQVSFPGPSFLRDRTWLTVTQIGMHGPFAISGNIIELLLNMQARRLLDIYRIQQTASCPVSRNSTSHLHLEISLTGDSLGAAETTPRGPISFEDKNLTLETTKSG